MRKIGSEPYFEIDAPENRLSVVCHKVIDKQERKYRVFETRSDAPKRNLEQLLVGFEKVRHYHICPLIAWQKVPNGYEWLFPEPSGQNLEELLPSGPFSPNLVESFIDQALTLYGACEAHQWLPQNLHPRNLWLDSSELKLMEELEYQVETLIYTQLSAVPDTFPAVYMSPEEMHGQPKLSWASQEFRIGMLAYHMLTGQHPFGCGVQGFMKIFTGKPEPIAEELLLRHRPLCQRIMKLLRAG